MRGTPKKRDLELRSGGDPTDPPPAVGGPSSRVCHVASLSTATPRGSPHVLGRGDGGDPRSSRDGEMWIHPEMWILPLPPPTLGCSAQHPWVPLSAAPVFTHRPLRLEQAQKLR